MGIFKLHRCIILEQFADQFFKDILATRWYEYLAVAAGIVSVWYSKKENVLVYPTGLINTIIYVYISFKGHLLGEASVNFYYTIMSIIGWYNWTRKDAQNNFVLRISASSANDWYKQLIFFSVCYAVIFAALTYFKTLFFEGVIPWADALASAAAFTGMWLMTKKKIESWYWWMITNLMSIPLYAVKHYALTSVYYLILLIMAVAGLLEWKKRYKLQKNGI